MKISYNWLKWYIPDAPSAEKLVDILNYHVAEVENTERRKNGDSIFDIKILPNRAHDLLSHQGIAREVASLLNIQYIDPTPKYKIPESKPTNLKIEITTDKCRRYMGRIVKNVKIGPSPDWVVKHLESIGQRSINNMVDAANIVMFDCGQPAHVFDLDKIKEKIIIKQAKKKEIMMTLDKVEVKFQDSNMVIADTGNVLAVAGVKGGQIAEVNNNTKDLILEVANFDPVSVRKTAQVLNIFTDARKRFENDLSPELGPYAMRELSALIAEMCPEAIFEDVVDVYPQKQEKRKLSFSIERISKILGLKVSIPEVEDILKRYLFKYVHEKGIFEITVPPMRLDLSIEEDMAEEVGRILGYDKVKGKTSKISFQPKINEEYEKIKKSRDYLISQGYSEIMTSIFCSKGKLEVEKSASDKKFLRTNLKDSLFNSVGLNSSILPLLGIRLFNDLKIFEIGTIWNPKEKINVAYFNGAEHKQPQETSLEDFYKNISSDFSPEPARHNLKTKFKMWSLFPFIVRDVAVWVPKEVESDQVLKVIKDVMGELVVKGPELFDEFKKGNQISYAFRLVFQSYDRTLTDLEINDIMTKITNKIKEKNGWQVR